MIWIAAKSYGCAVLDGHDPTACIRAIEWTRATDLTVTGSIKGCGFIAVHKKTLNHTMAEVVNKSD
jgi:hypothetical protein